MEAIMSLPRTQQLPTGTRTAFVRYRSSATTTSSSTEAQMRTILPPALPLRLAMLAAYAFCTS